MKNDKTCNVHNETYPFCCWDKPLTMLICRSWDMSPILSVVSIHSSTTFNICVKAFTNSNTHSRTLLSLYNLLLELNMYRMWLLMSSCHNIQWAKFVTIMGINTNSTSLQILLNDNYLPLMVLIRSSFSFTMFGSWTNLKYEVWTVISNIQSIVVAFICTPLSNLANCLMQWRHASMCYNNKEHT